MSYAHHIFQLQDLLGHPSKKNKVLSIIEGWVLLPGNDLLPHKTATKYILAMCVQNPRSPPRPPLLYYGKSGLMTLWIVMGNTSFLYQFIVLSTPPAPGNSVLFSGIGVLQSLTSKYLQVSATIFVLGLHTLIFHQHG